MTDSELKTRTTRMIMALVSSLVARDYEQAEKEVVLLAKEYGYDAEAVFKKGASMSNVIHAEFPRPASEIRESIREAFLNQAAWRREKAENHPEDSKNSDAAATLERLARTVDEIDPDLLARYDKQFDSERQSELLGSIWISYETASDFLNDFLRV